MAASPLNHFSRLLCPRKLDERQAYTMFLVPAFEAGRIAGLGIDGTPQTPDQPAWTAATTDSLCCPFISSRVSSPMRWKISKPSCVV